MKKSKERNKIIKELLDITDREFTDEELIHKLIMTEMTEKDSDGEKTSFGQRAADAVAKFAGSWAFIFSFIAVMVIWMVLNVVLAQKAFDAYPFILLNLVLSCIAAVQAPLIMMSQNRQEAKDRRRAENDYKINLKNELIIDDLHKKLDLVLENQMKIEKKKDSGEVTVCGESVEKGLDKIARKLGVVFQNSLLDKPLTVRQNLQSRAALYGITGKNFERRLSELCRLFELSDILDRAVAKLSGGQRRRADIARALLHEPEILILDEPTTGLDPQTRKLLWDAVTSLRNTKKTTVFLTTHYMEEAADADYIVILDSGKISAKGTPLSLKNTYTGDFITIYGVQKQDVEKLGRPFTEIRDAFNVEVENTAAATELIISHPDIFKDYEITKGKMDDVFLAVTGKKLMGGMDK